MVLAVPPKKSAALPIIGWFAAIILVLAAAVVLVTVIRSAGKRQELRTVDVKRLYGHCKLVRGAVATDALELLDPNRKAAAAARFGTQPLHSEGEIQLCARTPVDLSARSRCADAQDYGCLVFLARQASDALTETLRNEP